MTKAAEILRGVDLEPGFQASLDRVDFDEEIGFLRDERDVRVVINRPRAMLYGFGWSGWQQNNLAVAEHFIGKTHLHEIEPSLRTIARQGRGTGARMYNTPQAALGAREDVAAIGLYGFTLDVQKIEDKRSSRLQQRARSFGLLMAGKLLEEERAAYILVNRKTKDSHGLLYSQTPDGERQKQRKHAPASAVPERLMVIRKPHTSFTRVGRYVVDKARLH